MHRYTVRKAVQTLEKAVQALKTAVKAAIKAAKATKKAPQAVTKAVQINRDLCRDGMLVVLGNLPHGITRMGL